jgi:transcriptional regulator with XRE-family HTH domain
MYSLQITHEGRHVIGSRLRQSRKQAKLTQAALAKAVGTTRGYIAKLEQEKERIEPGARLLFSIANYLGVSGWWLIGSRNDPKPAEFLTDDEQELIEKYRKLDQKGKDAIRMIANESSALFGRLTEQDESA